MTNQVYKRPEKNMLLFISSIAMIVSGCFAAIGGLLIAIGGGLIGGALGSLGDAGGVFAVLGATIGVFILIFAALYIFAGIYGFKNSDRPEKATTMMVIGVIYSIVTLLSLLGGITFSSLLAFIIPVAYTIGAYQLKNLDRL